jgi:integrase
MFTYKKLKMHHKCLEDFASTGVVCQRPVSKAPPRPPSDAIIAATLAAWEALGNGDSSRNLFLAIGHELAFGLRAGEVAQARWDWWTVKYGSPMLCASGQFKHNHEGYFELPALDPYFTIMKNKATARGWMPSAPSTTYRTDGVQREVSLFLRNLGWDTNKTNHALRAYAGGLVALKYGIYKAKEFLRHSSVKVTEQHYMYLLKHPLIDSVRDACPAKWATIEPAAPILSIVERSA